MFSVFFKLTKTTAFPKGCGMHLWKCLISSWCKQRYRQKARQAAEFQTGMGFGWNQSWVGRGDKLWEKSDRLPASFKTILDRLCEFTCRKCDWTASLLL